MGLLQTEYGVLAVNSRLVEVFGINCWECGLFLATVGSSLKMASPDGENQLSGALPYAESPTYSEEQ